MAKGFKAGVSTIPLNFKVVGGTAAPANPGENTIWINTAITISNWIFDTAQPDTTVEGTVWIQLGTASEAEFNALKKNAILLCPLSAKQYVSGAWVTKTAKSYRGGAWLTWWDGYLYRDGDQCTAVTGGWSSSGYVFWDWPCNAAVNATHMSISLVSNSASGGVGTANKVDLSGHTKLKASVDPEGESLYVCVLKNKSDDMYSSGLARTTIAGSAQTVTLDITSISEGYIGFGTSGSAKIYSVWLE